MPHFSALNLLNALLLGLIISNAIVADEKILCDKKFKIVTADGETEIGEYGLKAITDEQNNIVIDETAKHVIDGRKFVYKSKIVYKGTEPYWPLTAETACTLDDKLFMEGKVTFKGYFIDLKATAYFDFASGEKHVPPKTHVWDSEPGPGQIVLFQPALAFIGPKLLPQSGNRNDLSFAEFPDDVYVDELIAISLSHRIVRTKPNDKGHFTIAMLGANKDNIELEVTLDKDNKIVAMKGHAVKFVEITEQ